MRPAESGGGSDDGHGRRPRRPPSLERLPAHHEETTTTTGGAEDAAARPKPGSRLEPSSFSEAVAIVPESPTEKRSFVSECTYACQQRFRELVLYEPRLTPTRYSSTMVLYSYSTRKRFKDRVDFLPRLRAKSFSETIFTFPKSTLRAFTSTFTQNTPRPLRQYTSGVELSPYITMETNDGTPSGTQVESPVTATTTADIAVSGAA